MRWGSPTRSPAKGSCRPWYRAGSVPRPSFPGGSRRIQISSHAIGCSATIESSRRWSRAPLARAPLPGSAPCFRRWWRSCSRCRSRRARCLRAVCCPAASISSGDQERAMTEASLPESNKSEPAFRRRIVELFRLADVEIDGDRPRDLRVHDPSFFLRALLEGALGVGEAYMDGLWDCDRLDELFHRVVRARLDQEVATPADLWVALKARLLNRQSPSRAFEVGEKHYDIGNDLYRRMLDKHMLYTCGYWSTGAADLDQAQEAKVDLICRKIALAPGMKILDLCCGWAGFSKYAAEKFGASAVALTVSREQVELGKELCRGLPVDIRLQDYPEAEAHYDRVVATVLLHPLEPNNYHAF